MPVDHADLFQRFAAAPPLAQIPHLKLDFGRQGLDDHSSPPRIVMAWSEQDERYSAAASNDPNASDTAASLLWMRTVPVEFHLWAAALTSSGHLNGAAEEKDHLRALEQMQQVVCQALRSQGVWTRYQATPRSLRKNRLSAQNSVLGFHGVLTVDVRIAVQDVPDLLVTVTSMTSTAALDDDA